MAQTSIIRGLAATNFNIGDALNISALTPQSAAFRFSSTIKYNQHQTRRINWSLLLND
jgi:hypothetical protein